MENKYLNLTGAVYIISKIKTLLGDKSDKGHTHSKEEIGLGNVENKSSQTIRGELTSDNVIKALGYTPPKENTTYAVMKGATASAAGTSGLVPAPAAGDQGKYLRGDGTYGTPTNLPGQTVGTMEFFALLYIAYEIVSILKNMSLCGLPVKKVWHTVKKALSKYTNELPTDSTN